MTFLDVDSTFDARRITRLHHQLADHPLLTVEALTDLALRQRPERVRFHEGERAISHSLGPLLDRDRSRDGLKRALGSLDRSNAFVQINGLAEEVRYRALLNAVLDEVAQYLPPDDRALAHRDAAVFLASPGSVTPFHLDHDQNFLCHLRGWKTLLVWDPADRSLVSPPALERFFRDGSQLDVVYHPSFRAKAHAFPLRPGDTVYMPMHAPHAVLTGGEISVSLSIVMNTPSSMAEADAWRANFRLRELGLDPMPVGRHRLRDQLKWRALRGLRQLRDRWTGHPAPNPQWY